MENYNGSTHVHTIFSKFNMVLSMFVYEAECALVDVRVCALHHSTEI